MTLEIRDMRPEDMDGKAYVHWKSWQETYPSLMDPACLAGMTLEKCQKIARARPDNISVAEWKGRIVGFSGSGKNHAGENEVFAIYLLREAQGLGIGRKLMDAAMERLDAGAPIFLWVLKGNERAIGFYKHYGFRLTGQVQETSVGTELRMVLEQKDQNHTL